MALTLRLTEEDERTLDKLTRFEKVSRQEAIVRAIYEATAAREHEDKVNRASTKMRQRYADVLERLGQ